MKILFVGDLSSYARAKQRYLAMQDLGHNLSGLPWVPLEAELNPDQKPSLWARIRRKVGYPVDPVGLNKSVIPEIISFQPDLLWVEKANTILPSIYLQIKTVAPELKIVYYSEDDIYVPNNRSAYLRKALPVFDVVYTTKPRNLQELPKLGARRVCCVYQAYEQNFHRPIFISSEDQQRWGADVSFIGTFERDRAEQMLFLAEQGVQMRVWGANWQDWQGRHPNLQVEAQAVYSENFLKVIGSSKINLNFLRKANRDRHTSRSLEIPACQGFMLAERTEEHLHLFREGKEAEFFDSPDELLEKVKYYLAHTEERAAIARAGRERCLASGYSHHDRLKVMFAELLCQPTAKISIPTI
jgi:spore maturation protein CgeB